MSIVSRLKGLGAFSRALTHSARSPTVSANSTALWSRIQHLTKSTRGFSDATDDEGGNGSGSIPLQADEDEGTVDFNTPSPDLLMSTRGAPHRRIRISSKGERLPSKLDSLYAGDPLVAMYRETTGFNEFVNTPHAREGHQEQTENLWGKHYFRDEQGNAVLPARYKNVDLAGLDKALQKADHYFFGANVPPHLMVMDDPDEDKWYNPDGSVRPVQLNTPRDLLAESKLIKDGFDEEAVEDLETVLSSKVFNSRDGVVKQLQHIYAEAAADARGDNGPGANHTVQRPLDLERFRGAPDFVPREPGTEADYITDEQREISRAMTLKERRVEFWGKFQEQMTFIETAVTGSVRVTRATGRVRSSYVVTIMGNEKGVVCYGRGKGATSELAMRRSIYAAPRNMMYVPLHEKRTIFIPCVGKFKRTMVFAKPMPREFGLHVPPHLYDLVEALGIQDISIKVMGSRNRYNVLQAFMEVLKQQVSYRELAMRRGMHYETMMDPFHKNPPPPTKAELAEIEKDASEQFAKAVEATIRNRDLVQVPPYEEFEPVLELREEFKQSWQRHLDTKGVPPALQRFPPFSEYLDTLKALENGEEDLLGVADDPMFEEDEDLEMLNADVEENYNDNDARHHESDYPTENEEEEEDSSYERHETRGQKYSVQV